MTWKLSPTYDLASIKAAFNDGDKHDVTSTAAKSAAALGFVRADIVETIQRMERVHFYKSMTSYEDHRVWQDVYHVPSYVGTLYVKFTRDAETGEFLLLSFKEKNND
jgi:motility quorum-sensing regulator/GCU-specific mRNA interferase toxin